MSYRDQELFELNSRQDYAKRANVNKKVSEREYVAFYFRADSEKHFYQREIYDVLSYLGDLGGLFDILFIIGISLTSFFFSKLFLAALIGQAY